MRASADLTKSDTAVYECAMCRLPVTKAEDNGIGYCDAHWRVVHPQRVRRLIGSMHRNTARPAHNRRAGNSSRNPLQVK